MVKIELTLESDGQMKILWPQDRPFVALKMLDLAKEAIANQAAANEGHRLTVAPAGSIPQILNGR